MSRFRLVFNIISILIGFCIGYNCIFNTEQVSLVHVKLIGVMIGMQSVFESLDLYSEYKNN